MIPSLERARQRGRELFLTVLGRELVAHRALWIGIALVFLCAAFVWPLMSGEGFTSLQLLLSTGAACGAFTALYLVGLVAVLLSVRSTVFPDTAEGRFFMKLSPLSLAHCFFASSDPTSCRSAVFFFSTSLRQAMPAASPACSPAVFALRVFRLMKST